MGRGLNLSRSSNSLISASDLYIIVSVKLSRVSLGIRKPGNLNFNKSYFSLKSNFWTKIWTWKSLKIVQFQQKCLQLYSSIYYVSYLSTKKTKTSLIIFWEPSKLFSFEFLNTVFALEYSRFEINMWNQLFALEYSRFEINMWNQLFALDILDLR